MEVEFYNVKTRQRVKVNTEQVWKVVFHRSGQGSSRYAVRAEYEGTPLTKFVSKSTFDTLDVPER